MIKHTQLLQLLVERDATDAERQRFTKRWRKTFGMGQVILNDGREHCGPLSVRDIDVWPDLSDKHDRSMIFRFVTFDDEQGPSHEVIVERVDNEIGSRARVLAWFKFLVNREE